MGFPADEKRAMLALKGVGPTVIARLEQIGFGSLADLRGADVAEITRRAAELVGSTCWRNSPQARAAIAAVVSLAERSQAEPGAASDLGRM
ncbi:MAG: hypothetical protein K2V38_24955 [Gemmataceae bacterium]|nr:hypothetical protein [Gemmataceae bacterium]